MADEEKQATLRESLEGAFEEITPVEPDAPTPVADSRVRAEDGKFARTDAKTETQEPEKVERPSTWKKEYWEKYDKLDPDLRKYILQRDNEYKSGLATYNAEVKASKTLKEAIEPFMPELQRHNIDPSQWIRNLGNAHQTLALGSPQAKAQMFAKLAQDYGVDLRSIGVPQQGQLDPQLQYLSQNLQGLQQQWQQFQNQQQLSEQQAISETIEEFKADADQHPHFEAVREAMAGLLSSGMAQNLQEAYDKAIWMSPVVRDQIVAAQQQQDKLASVEKQRAAATKAKANAVSPRSVTPGAAVAPTGKKGLRDSLSEAFGDLSSRV